MSKYYGFESTDKMIEKIKEWNFDYMTSTYYALLHRKRNGMEIILPMVRNSTNTAPPVRCQASMCRFTHGFSTEISKILKTARIYLLFTYFNVLGI